MSLVLIYFVLFSLAILIIFFFSRKKFFRLDLRKSLNYQLFLITVPRDLPEGEKTKKLVDFISPFEQLIESFSRYKKDIVLEIAVPHNSEEICFYVAINRASSRLLEKAVTSLFPYARVEPTKDYTIFSPQGKTEGAILGLKNPFVLPLKTFSAFSDDPLATILNAFNKISSPGEGVALQLIIHSALEGTQKTLQKVRKSLEEGKGLEEALASPKTVFKESLEKQFTSSKEKEKEKPKVRDENLIKLVTEKAQYPIFQVNLRLLTSAATEERAKELLEHLENSFSSLNNPLGNRLVVKKIRRKRGLKQLVYNFSFRLFQQSSSSLLNSAEIATIFHFPHPLIVNPRIKWLKARSAPPPLNLPSRGVCLGKSNFAGEEKDIRLGDEDRRRHVYIVGQTGTGKSSLLDRMFVQDIQQGKGAGFIDPHGDIAERILGEVPEERKDDVIYFNPGDPQYALGLNLLERDPRYSFQKTFVINELLEIIDKLYNLKETGGPVFEQYFRYALLLLLDDPEGGHTLNDISRVFVNPDYRLRLLEKTPNPMVKEFWQKQAEKAGGELSLANVAPYVVSKLNPFLANDLVRPIVSQVKNSLDFRKIIDEKKIFIVNLSKGALGEINSYLLGMLVVAQLTMAAFSRQDIPEEQRQDFYLYIDEFQNITTDTISTVFSEGRKYHLNLTVANQFLAQLKELIRKAVFGNVGTIISFRVGTEDAEMLAKYFAPVFTAHDLMNLDNFNAYVKLMIEGKTSRPFDFHTIKPPSANLQLAKEIKDISNRKYARRREEVEEEIREKYQ